MFRLKKHLLKLRPIYCTWSAVKELYSFSAGMDNYQWHILNKVTSSVKLNYICTPNLAVAISPARLNYPADAHHWKNQRDHFTDVLWRSYASSFSRQQQ